MPLAVILSYLTQILALVPQGTALWQSFQQRKTLVEQIQSESRDPTADEWAALDATVAAEEAAIDAAATRA